MYVDGVQSTRPQNMATCHTEHFKLKGIETANAGRILWPPPSSLMQVIRPSHGRWPVYTWRKRASLSPKMEGPPAPRGIQMKRPCCVSYGLLRVSHTLFSYYAFLQLSTLHQTWYKTLWFNHFFQVFISFWRLLCHLKLLWSTSVCFSLPNPSFVSLIYKSPAGESRREGEKDFFPPLHVHEQSWWCCLMFEDWKAGWSKVQR